MTSEELAETLQKFVESCVGRILGVGRQQYGQDPAKPQKFETMDLNELFEYAHEELQDTVVYAVMLDIRLHRLQKIIEDAQRNVTRRAYTGKWRDDYRGDQT